MELSKEELNEKLYMTAAHLVEAAKIISDVDKSFALKIFEISDKLLSIIVPEKEFIDSAKVDSIMNEIFGVDNGNV